jgi:hypothetical protein
VSLARLGLMGGDEDRLLWELPLVRGWQYQHAGLVMDGARVTITQEAVAERVEEMKREIVNGN